MFISLPGCFRKKHHINFFYSIYESKKAFNIFEAEKSIAMRKIGLIVLSVLCVQVLFSQDQGDAYVEKIRPLIGLRPFVQQNVDILTITDKRSTFDPFIYRTAATANVGIEFSFKFMRFAYSRNVPFLQSSLPADFNPRSQNFALDMGGRVFGIYAEYRENIGYLIQNQGLVSDTLYASSDARSNQIYRPSYRSQSLGFGMRWTFSTSLSANALFNQTERQKKSKGAFTFMVSNRYHNVEIPGNEFFMPVEVVDSFPITANSRRIWINNIQFMPGYGYIAAAGEGKWNMGLFLYTGSGPQIRKVFNKDGTTETKVKFPYIVRAMPGVCYNGKFWFSRLSAQLDYSTFGMDDARMGIWNASWEFSFGIRFYEAKNK